MSDFIIESKGYCFFCLEEISPQMPGNDSMVQSLQYLSRFLGVDWRKIFPDTENIPPHLLTKVERSRLKGKLCDGCAGLNDSFSKVCRRLEKIELEAMSSLDHIYRKLLRGPDDPDQFSVFLDSTEESRNDWSAKLDILKILRTDATQKCFLKLGKARPRVKVQNLTKRNIIEVKNQFKFKSDRLRARNSNDMNPSPNLPSSHAAIKSELVENVSDTWNDYMDAYPQADFKQDVGESDNDEGSHTSFAKPKEETIFSVDIRTRRKVKGREINDRTGIRSDKNYLITGSRSSPRDLTISKNIEIVQGEGEAQIRYRCKLCSKLLSERRNATRHILSVHLKERRHRCSICNKSYTQKKTLLSHMNYHKGVKPHKCHICPSKFIEPGNLRQHLLVHSGIKRYKCNLCDKSYIMRYELTRHLKKTHNSK